MLDYVAADFLVKKKDRIEEGQLKNDDHQPSGKDAKFRFHPDTCNRCGQ